MVNSPPKSSSQNESLKDFDKIDEVKSSRRCLRSNTKCSTFDINLSDENMKTSVLKKHNLSSSRNRNHQSNLNCWISKKKPEPLNIVVTKKSTSKSETKNEFPTTSNKKTVIKNVLKNKNSKSSVLKPKIKNSSLSCKYDNKFPTAEEIKSKEKELKTYMAQIKEILDIDVDPIISPVKKDLNIITWLDCKKLTLEEISEYFDVHRGFIQDIFNGKTEHLNYKDSKIYQKSSASLISSRTFNPSTVVFDYDQLLHMATLLEKEFQTEDDKIVYFFQVLIPQLCLKIFQELHNMTESEAKEYLDKRPVD